MCDYTPPKRKCSTISLATGLSCLRAGGKLIAFGNGGSAAEAEHLVTELVGRYRTDRQALAVAVRRAATCLGERHYG